ncbi:hypothetical protein EH165_09775 [Nakamurella antarctica]|uniref:Uncharacterized protein n=1 Tax=Nakamurella antarctica TaxID=1902245 RepID=A0A3G8ZNL9_9ACTN|nr:hypothetical protein [Nakamurella antarctica]AZI58385.1 hypothetical protein EH165_09775 [Nakamurella antarctica]
MTTDPSDPVAEFRRLVAGRKLTVIFPGDLVEIDGFPDGMTANRVLETTADADGNLLPIWEETENYISTTQTEEI